MSRRVHNNKGKHVKFEEMATSCHVCKAHEKPAHVIESHNFRNARGKVCCPTMLENVCSKCGLKGHFQSRCEVSTVFKPFKSFSMKTSENNAKKENKEKPKVVPVNAFAALAEESSDEEEERIKNDPPPANVTLRKPDAKKDWADYESDDEW
jgi:hypothetical protein